MGSLGMSQVYIRFALLTPGIARARLYMRSEGLNRQDG